MVARDGARRRRARVEHRQLAADREDGVDRMTMKIA
jgi:hypothetical protein